jgi:hypothetical protein
MTASYQRKVVVPIEYLVATRELFQGIRGAHKRPGPETPDIDGDDGACLSSYLSSPGLSPKHLRKMVEVTFAGPR